MELLNELLDVVFEDPNDELFLHQIGFDNILKSFTFRTNDKMLIIDFDFNFFDKLTQEQREYLFILITNTAEEMIGRPIEYSFSYKLKEMIRARLYRTNETEIGIFE